MMLKAGVAMAALGMTAVSLQGCGGKPATTATTILTTTTTTVFTTVTPPTTTTPKLEPLPPQKNQAFVPIKGILYQAWPTGGPPKDDGAESEAKDCKDLMQLGYKDQFHTLRDDLGLIRSMGANTVRVQVGIGSELKNSHAEFLDRAQELGLNVIVDFETLSLCSDTFDCYDKWNSVTTTALTTQGFKSGSAWHPAVKAVMLMSRPEGLAFTTDEGPTPSCPVLQSDSTQKEPWCRLKAVLSAFDGFLKAESDAGVVSSTVKVGVAWTMMLQSGVEETTPTVLYGFSDVQKGIAKPELANSYQFKYSNYKQAYDDRWVNAINSQNPWSAIKEQVVEKYTPFKAQKLFISSMTSSENTINLEQDLKEINTEATNSDFFLGVVVDGFLTDIGGSSGMFKAGSENLIPSSSAQPEVCREDPHKPEESRCSYYTLNCLEVDPDGHLEDVTKAWAGPFGPAIGLCKTVYEVV